MPSVCPLIGPQSLTRPLIGHCLSSINTVLRLLHSLISAASVMTLGIEDRVTNPEQWSRDRPSGQALSVSVYLYFEADKCFENLK